MSGSNHIRAALVGWESLLPSQFYRVTDGRRTTERGIKYFENGRVTVLQVEEPGKSWSANVSGQANYDVKIFLESGEIGHTCSCPAHRENGDCKHVVAVVALLYFLAQGRIFGFNRPNQVYTDGIVSTLTNKADISEIPTKPPAKKKPAIKKKSRSPAKRNATRKVKKRNAYISISQSPRGMPVANLHGYIPQSVAAKLSMSSFPWEDGLYTRFFPLDDIAERLASFAKTALNEGISVNLIAPDGEAHPVSGVLKQVELYFQINYDHDLDAIELAQVVHRELPPTKVQLASDCFFTENGAFVKLDNSRRNQLVDIADPNNTFEIYDGTFRAYPVYGRSSDEPRASREFNALSLCIPFPRYKKSISETAIFTNGESVDITALTGVRKIAGKVSIISKKGSEDMTVRLHMLVGDHDLDAKFALLPMLMEALSGLTIDERLLSAKRRRTVLIQAARLMALTPSKRDRSQIISEAAEDKSFVQLRLKAKARRWLRAIENNWINAKGPHLLAIPSEASGWTLCESPRLLFLQLLLGLNTPETTDDIYGLSTEYTIPKAGLPEFIHRANLVCKVAGVPLHYDESEVTSTPVEIQLDAESTKDIDWFELKAEIRCGELTIPPDQWEALIKGELLLEQDGRLVIPELSQAEALERLRVLFSKPKRGKRGASERDNNTLCTPRLQMLDWIELRKKGVHLNLPDDVEQVWRSLTEFKEIPKTALPSSISATLRNYQQRGFDWMVFLYQHRFGACLADDMGLGKTLQAIAFLAWAKATNPKCRPCLIVLPPSLIFNWRHEIERFCPDLTIHEYIGGERSLDDALGADVLLTTYDLVRRDIDHLKETTFEVVIFDEVQALKNVSAVRTKAATQLKRRFTLCLTGTPMENHAGEYYSIMNLATPGIFGDYAGFRRTLRNGDDRILRRARPFMLRRTKDEILTELPPKVESETYLDMTNEQKEIYTRTVGEVREEVMAAYRDRPKEQAGILALAALTRLRQVCISPELLGKPIKHPAPKIEFLLGKMQELLDEGSSALFFSQFTRTLDLLQASVKEQDISVLRLDGKTPVKKRKEMVEAFQLSDTPQLFLISLKAGGAGLNLTRAQYVFHIDPWWNPAVENQASDRAHRIGQTKTVFIQRLLMRHSVEEKIMELKKRKQKLFEAIVGSSSATASTGSLVSKDDFEFLLS